MDLPGVDLIEELHQHKRREEDGEVPRGQAAACVLLGAVVLGPVRHLLHVARRFVERERLGVGVVERGDARFIVSVILLVKRYGAAAAQDPPVVLVDLPAHQARVQVEGVGGAHIADGEDDDKEEQHLVARVPHERADHALGQERLVAGVGGAGEEVGAGVLGGKCDRSKRVHDHVDPEQLDHVQRGFGEDGRADDGNGAGGEVDGELEL
mmetsp:Transcript_31673/g.77670  ORF Transcript_31673/g.77670 Transcript_31673/m.77670 type:complete len:210 (+) Transcript_31673:725-1354(+)